MTRLTTRALRHLREDMGLTRAALAARTGINEGYLSQIESEDREVTVKTLNRLARGFGVPFCGLLARLGFDCGCDWGELSRHPVMHLFGRLAPEDSVLVIEVMRRLVRDQPEAGPD